MLNAYGVIKVPTLAGIAAGIAMIGLGTFLAVFFKMGLPGMAVGDLLMTLTWSFILAPIFTCHVLKADVRQYWAGSFFIPMFLTLISFSWELLFLRDSHFSMKFIILVAVGLSFYVLLVLRFVFNENEKKEGFLLLKTGFFKTDAAIG